MVMRKDRFKLWSSRQMRQLSEVDAALPYTPEVIRAAKRQYARQCQVEKVWEDLVWEDRIKACYMIKYYGKEYDKVLNVICPYCGEQAKMVTGRDIYPKSRNLWSRSFYRCEPCDAYVGCHAGTLVPLGTLANANLRAWRRAAHQAFDPLWEENYMTRTEAYAWLQQQLDLTKEECHIGQFTYKQCRSAISACRIWRLCREEDDELKNEERS